MSRLALTWPFIYAIHFTLIICLGITIILLATVRGGMKKHRVAFWVLFAFFISSIVAIFNTLMLQLVFIPRFWRSRAREMVTSGMFDPTSTRSSVYGHNIVLEVGCSEGMVSGSFAKEILAHQRDTPARFPLFIGHDRWSKWTRIPNNTTCYLEELIRIGVPRHLIRTSRVDETNSETRTTLPFANNSISLVISYFGLDEISGWNKPKERRMLFSEMARVVVEGGAMILFENSGTGTEKGDKKELKPKSWFEGPMHSYKRYLVHELGWDEEWVQVHRKWGIEYLVARKGVSV
ncbi:SubName: Full=Uncharacterized protein {ECO:0000313/EMBL:CCA71338.1} [Serendipita indica DSM 11827]|nr:SubName: Full=Uncharacterized protein {ECO:0000313/EMBL:CCA71338.1} [Serendipita indica DSM 11827]